MTETATHVQGVHLIAGEASAAGNGTFSSVNPRNGERNAVQFSNATDAEIDRAVQEAAAAYAETRLYPTTKLADFLDKVADEIEELGEPLFATTDRETALGLPRLRSELGRTTGQLRKFGALLREGSYVRAVIDTSDPERTPQKRDVRRMLLPIGPVAVFAASNFPYAFSVAGGDTASAFAAGCPVVLKAHPAHPETSELVGRAINRAIARCNFPRGFFSLLHGEQIDVGQNLVKHPLIAAVGFTGSLRGGRAIFDTAAARPVPIPVYAEMGSINPVVILPGALKERRQALVDGLTGSLTLGTGQFCTNPGLVLVPHDVAGEAFIEEVTQKLDSDEPGILLNPQIERGLQEAVTSTLQSNDVQKLRGGRRVEGNACRYEHTVMRTTAQAFRQNEALQREHFGPVVLFVTYESPEDVLQTINVLHGTLTATIHATAAETKQAAPLYEQLREKAGRLIWNGFPTGVEVVHSMQHGGPYPATTAPATTSVGMVAIERFMRPVAYQDVPDELLPPALQNANPLGIWRIVNDERTKAAV